MIRIPLWTLQLAGLIASAALVVAVGWFILAAFLSAGTYIETVIP